MTVTFEQVVNDGLMYINNLQISNDATTPNTKIDVAAGQCRDSTNQLDMILASPVVINAAANGVNGLDTGSLAASTWYYVYLIMDVTEKNATAAILSANASTPLLPFGYSSYRLLGYARTDGSSHLLLMYIAGNGNNRNHYWDSTISVLSGGTATTLTLVSLAAAVPPVDGLPVLMEVSYTPASAGQFVSLAPAGSVATLLPKLSGSVAAVAQVGQLELISKLSSSVAQIQYINSAAAGASTLLVCGFKYSL